MTGVSLLRQLMIPGPEYCGSSGPGDAQQHGLGPRGERLEPGVGGIFLSSTESHNLERQVARRTRSMSAAEIC